MMPVVRLKEFNEDAHPRAPAGSSDGGQFTSGGGSGGGGREGPASSVGVTGGRLSAAARIALDQAPTGSAGRAKWQKEVAETYSKDAEFRNVADTVAHFTQGAYDDVRNAVLDAKGIPALRREGELVRSDFPLSSLSNPFSDSTNFIKGQDIEHREDITVKAGGMAVERAIQSSLPLAEAFHRGIMMPHSEHVANQEFGVWLATVKEGDTFDLNAPTSFSASQHIAEQFATGSNSGQRFRGDTVPGVLLSVAPGAKGLKVSALSPWKNQQEVLSSGKFRVTKVEGERPRVFHGHRPTRGNDNWVPFDFYAFQGRHGEVRQRIFVEQVPG